MPHSTPLSRSTRLAHAALRDRAAPRWRVAPRVGLCAFALIVVAMFLAACASADESAFENSAASPQSPVAMDSRPREAAAATERVVLRTADISVVVDEPSKAAAIVGRMADELGGFIVSSHAHQLDHEGSDEIDGDARASVAIRVPAAKLDLALERIERAAIEVTARNISGTDVTQEYTDARSRVRNLQSAEEQLLAVMQKAKETEGVLAVLQRLTNVRSEIEVLEGRIRYFREASRLALIQVELRQPERQRVAGAWDLANTAGGSFRVLLDVVQFLSRALVFVAIVVLPLGLLGFFFLYLPLRVIRRRKVVA
jgi:hypothetical protein